MPKITEQQIDVLKLIQRSPNKDEDGWTRCSQSVSTAIQNKNISPDLVRTRGLFVRLTTEAEIVLKRLG